MSIMGLEVRMIRRPARLNEESGSAAPPSGPINRAAAIGSSSTAGERHIDFCMYEVPPNGHPLSTSDASFPVC